MEFKKYLWRIALTAALGIAGCNLFNPTQSVDIASDDAAALTYEGYLHYQKTEYGMAREYFERGIRADSAYSEAWYGYAKAVASMQPGLNPFELVKLTKSTATDPFGPIYAMNDKDAAILRSGIDSVMMVLNVFIHRDTTGLTDKRVRFSQFADSYSILSMVRAGLIARDARVGLSEIFYADSGGVHFDLGRLGTDAQKAVQFMDAMAQMAEGVKADPKMGATLVKGMMPDSSAEWFTDKAFNDLVVGVSNQIIDGNSRIQQTDMSRVDVFLNIGNGIDEDGDGCLDEEIKDGFDNDGDGEIDEDTRSESVIILETDITKLDFNGKKDFIPVRELQIVGLYENGGVDIDMNGKAGEDDPYEWNYAQKDFKARKKNNNHLLQFITPNFYSTYFLGLDYESRIALKEKIRHDTDIDHLQFDLGTRKEMIGGCWNNYDEAKFRQWIMKRNSL